MIDFFELFHRYTGYEKFMYSLKGQNLITNAVFLLAVIAVMLALLFLIARKIPRVQVTEVAAATISGEQKQAETMAVKYCPNCGTELESDSAYCTNCGAKQA